METGIAVYILIFGLLILAFNKYASLQTARYNEWLFGVLGLRVDMQHSGIFPVFRLIFIIAGIGLAVGGIVLLTGA